MNYLKQKIFILSIVFFLPLAMPSSKPILLIENVGSFDVDAIGNLFVEHNSILHKFNENLEEICSFEDKSLGIISYFEVEDPLNILIYYAEAEKIVFLDNNLAPKRNTVDIADLGFPQATLTCSSYNNGFWIFDPISNQIIRYDNFLNQSQISGNISQIINETIQPIKLTESNEFVFLKDNEKGIIVFDKYGTFLKKIPMKKIIDFQLVDDNINMLISDTIFSFNMKNINIDTLPLPFFGVKAIKFLNDKIYYKEKAEKLYSLTLN